MQRHVVKKLWKSAYMSTLERFSELRPSETEGAEWLLSASVGNTTHFMNPIRSTGFIRSIRSGYTHTGSQYR